MSASSWSFDGVLAVLRSVAGSVRVLDVTAAVASTFLEAAPALAGMRHLRSLTLANNRIASHDRLAALLKSSAEGGFPALTALDLSGNGLIGICGVALGDWLVLLPRLARLTLSGNALGSGGVAELCPYLVAMGGRLTHLDLMGAKLTPYRLDYIVSSLLQCTALERTNLCVNDFAGATAPFRLLRGGSGGPPRRHLALRSCKLGGGAIRDALATFAPRPAAAAASVWSDMPFCPSDAEELWADAHTDAAAEIPAGDGPMPAPRPRTSLDIRFNETSDGERAAIAALHTPGLAVQLQ
jgi:hypothetical protein